MLNNLKDRAVALYNNACGYFQSSTVGTPDKVIVGFAMFATLAGTLGFLASGGVINLLLAVGGASITLLKLRA